ncbi:hypothetical protein [Cohnella mopanensis]|uniref:hypothetical protein n=1 Tax=Cohnella mopanensis TaxID=2911966 RepID=UPI001EF788FC|nr:hypothetical protein [Cohnella mopanensis]
MYIDVKNIYGSTTVDLSNLADILISFLDNNQTLYFAVNGCSEFEGFTIYDRMVFKSYDYVFPYDNHPRELHWFEPKDKEEILKVIDEDYLFLCIAVPKNSIDVRGFTYAIEVMDEDECCSLSIYCKNTEDFKNRVLSKVRLLLKEGMELLMEH